MLIFNKYYNMLTDISGGGEKSPAYLMTLEEYQKTVVPVLSEYNKFIKKNFDYLASTDYNGMFYYTFPELLSDVKKGTQKGFMFRRGEYDKGYSDEEFARRAFGYRKTGKFDKEYEPAKTPEGLTEKKNEYINKLRNYFTEEEIVRLIEKDELKSNKRTVKRAIDNDTYKKLLNEGKVTVEQIENVAESVGVKLPKKIFSESLKKSMESQALYDKIYASMPSVNKQVLSKMVDDIKETFKPLEKIIYERETKRYEKSILETLEQKEADVHKLHDWLHFFDFVFKYEKQEERKHKEKDRYNRDITVTTHWIVGLSLKDGWKDAVSKAVLEEIEMLKVNMIYSIIDNFQKITMPIESIEQVSLDVGAKGFEGTYKFKFKNGSSFIFKTEAIGAGGYNIQRYHFRYLTHFTDITLSDGTKVSNRMSIVEHFSDKEVSEKMFNPYFVIKKAETIEQIIDVFYNYFKGNYKYSSVRKSASKTDATVSYKINNTQRTKYFFLKRSDSLEENKKRAYSLLKELEVPKPESFDSETLEHGGGVSSFKSNLTEEQQKLVRTPEFKSWFGDWELLKRAKEIYKTDVKGIYKGVFDIDVEEALFTVSVQMHSSVKNMTNSFSQEILDIAEALYPNTKLGDEFYPVVSKVVDGNGEPLVVYHGFLSYSKKDWFYEFNRLPAFFSTRRAFAEQYAQTKSMDAGLDKDANTYECFLNIKKLFDPKDKNVVELARKKLPEKIKVSHGTMWFLDADLDKDYVVDEMAGIQTIYPDRMTDTILKINVGDVFDEPVSMSQYEKRILLYKDEDWAYTVDLDYFNEKTEKEVAEYVSRGDSYSRKSIKYKDKYFEPYVVDKTTFRMKLNDEPIAVEFRNDLEKYRKNLIENITTLKRVEEDDTHFEIHLKDYEKLKGYWGGTISIKKRNLKSYKVKANNNWTMFENETVQKFLLDNNFGGWISTEKGDKTYAVYEAQNIKLADGTNKTFDINNKDIRFDKGGQLTNEEKDDIYSRWKNLINMSYSELEKFYNSEEGREAGLSNKEANKLGIDSGRESARWIMKMKKTNKSEWTPSMWRWAKKQISFVSRMKGNKGGLYDEKGEKTRKHTSLLIWGHNPNKKSDGGSIAIEKVNRPKVDQLGFYSPIEKRILEFKSDRASVNKWKDIVGIKSDEAKFTGLSDYLNSKKPDEQLLKIELLNFIKDNHIELVLLNKNDSNTFLGETYIKERENGTYALAYRDTDEFVNDDEFDSPQELTDVYENEEIFSGNDVPYKTKYSKYVIKGNARNYTELLVMLPDKAQQNRLFYNKLFNLLSEQVKERMGIVPNTIEWNTFNIYDYKSKLTSDELHQLNYIDSLSNVRHNTFSTVHWDERNILVHLRFDIRKDENENDVLFINELQSDWGQRGKKSGFGGKYDINLLNKELKEAEYEYNKLDFHNLKLSEIWETPEANRVMDIKEKINQEENSIPLAPFVTDTNKWVKLGLKIAIQQAVLNNVKYLSWGSGEQQNELYDLSKSLNKISWWHVGTSENTWGVTAYDKNDKITKKERDVTLSDIEKLLGKDIAEKIKNHEGYTESVGQTMYGELTGDNLKLSGSGMIAFYGSVIKNELGIVGNVLKSLVKELTGKSDAIQTIKIPEGKGIVGNPTIEQLEQAKKLAHDSNDSDSVDFLQEQIDRMKSGKEYSYGLFNSNVPASFFFDKVREPSIYTEYAIEITDELKKSVDEGIPMFKVGGQIKAKNPYSICTVSLGRVIGTQKRSKWTSAQLKKYERCVLNVKKTMKDGGGVSVEDGGQFVVLSKMDNNRYVIYSDKDGYKITVNNPDDAKYIELFYDGKRIGVLEAREHYLNDYHGHTGKFLSIQAAYIDDGHKNKGFGLKMYQALKEFSADDIIGFFSDLENRQNKKVIPKIYSHFNNEIVGDYHIVTYNDGGVVSQTLYFAIYRMEDGNEHWYMVAKHEVNNDEQIETVKKLLDRAVDDNFKVKSITKKEYEDWDLGDEITTDEPTQFFKEGEISGEDYEKKQKGGSLCKCKFRTNRVPSKRINEYLLSLRK